MRNSNPSVRSSYDREEREWRTCERWETDMTICIAAICNKGKSIVMVADKMRSIGDQQHEFESHKIHILGPGWRLLTAGHTGRLMPAIRAIKSRLKRTDAEDVVDMVEEEYTDLLRKKAKRFDIPKAHAFEMRVSVLVCGFVGKRAVVASMNGSRPMSEHQIGFTAIGCGSSAATSSLMDCRYSSQMDLADAIYHVYAAKCAAEKISGVGVASEMRVLNKGENTAKRLDADDFQSLNAIREERMVFTDEHSKSLKELAEPFR